MYNSELGRDSRTTASKAHKIKTKATTATISTKYILEKAADVTSKNSSKSNDIYCLHYTLIKYSDKSMTVDIRSSWCM